MSIDLLAPQKKVEPASPVSVFSAFPYGLGESDEAEGTKSIAHSSTQAAQPPIKCRICYETVTMYSALGCGHNFCNECYSAFLTCRLREGSYFACCPEVSCPYTISAPLVASLVPEGRGIRRFFEAHAA